MAQNQNNSSNTKSRSVCDKIYDKVSGNSAFQSLHRVTHHPQSNSTPNPRVQNPAKVNPHVNKPGKRNAAPAGDISIEHEPRHEEDHKGKKSEMSTVNDKFSDYISKMKKKMRSVSNVGAQTTRRTPTRRDSLNDRVSNYINRAKIKIRTTTMADDSKKSSQ